MWLGVGDAVAHWGKYKPEKTAISVGGKNVSYIELYRKSTYIATTLIKNGTKGRIAIAVSDKIDFLACIVAIQSLGLSNMILSPYTNMQSLKIHLEDTKPEAIIGTEMLINKIKQHDNIEIKVFDISKISEDTVDIVIDNTPLLRWENEWGILFSSGSTGIPKAIVYDHYAITSELLAWCLELGIVRNSKFYIGRPIYYTGGLVLALATILVGGEIILIEDNIDNDFDAIWEDYLNFLNKYEKIDFAFFIPDQLRLFIKKTNNILAGPTILTMGAPITGDEKIKASQKLKSPIIESWGNSEGLGTITEPEDLSIRPNSIGRPFITEKIYIVRDDLSKCKNKEVGRLGGSAETMFTEYANRPEATEKIKNNNLVLSDDLGFVDEKGYFYISGRVQESFVVEGKTVFIQELEKKIRTIPEIVDTCIVAIELDCAVLFYAVIILKNDLVKDGIKETVNKALEITIKEVIIVDELPRLTSGKIDRLSAAEIVKKL